MSPTDQPAIRVLIVDDERDFLDSLAKRLTLRGLQVVAASSGAEALQVLERDAIDVVVLDVRMPGMDGVETLRRIKRLYPQVEVVMLTGHADLDASLEGMRLGFFDYLTKPVDIGQLVAKLRDAMRSRAGEPPSGAATFSAKLRDYMIAADRLASLGTLAASLAHEINNPMAIISESAGWLKSRVARGEDLPERLRADLTFALDKIESAVDRARRVSQNLLRFARSTESATVEVNLADLASEVVELTRKAASNGEVQLEVVVEPGLEPVLYTDIYQLRQVLLNLVTNAIDAVDRRGRVRVIIGAQGADLALAVEDDGVGIPPENLERIFEPFFTTKQPDRGTGLGLAVTRGIVEKLSGRIEVSSKQGEGSVFRVVLPRRSPETENGNRGGG